MDALKRRLEDAKLGAAIDNACGSLPEGWQILVSLEADCGDASLVNPDGDEVEFASNRESLAETIRDAIEHAKNHHAAAVA